MEETYVTLRTAELLDRAGFDWDTDKIYEACIVEKRYWDLPKPTLQMACHWLKEVHGIWIIAIPDVNDKDVFYPSIYKRDGKTWTEVYAENQIYDGFDEPEDAVEAALEYYLTNLVKN